MRQQAKESKRKKEKERHVETVYREGGRGSEQPGDRRRKENAKMKARHSMKDKNKK